MTKTMQRAINSQTVKQALKQITMSQVQKYVNSCYLHDEPNAVKTLGRVRSFFYAAGGGFNEASWETLRMTKTMTLDKLIEKMNCSGFMEKYIRAWECIEKAGFYASLIQMNLATINTLIDHYGEDKPYAELL